MDHWHPFRFFLLYLSYSLLTDSLVAFQIYSPKAISERNADFFSLDKSNSFRSSETAIQRPPFSKLHMTFESISPLMIDPQITPLQRTSSHQKQIIRQNRLAYVGNSHPLPRNDGMLRVLRDQPVDSIPVWIMRQAGRYLPEFRAVREKFDFLTVCKDPELAAEVSLQPYRRFPQLDAVIIFSDILVVPQAMGQPLHMLPGEGPSFDWKLTNPEDCNKLNLQPSVEDTLGYVFDAIFLLKEKSQNKIPIIGFCGGPFTVFAYMVEGQGSPSWSNARQWLYSYPEASHTLLKALTDISVEYLIKQYDAGASILQIFETHAGVLPPAIFEEFSAFYMQEIAKKVKEARPEALMIAFPKDRPTLSFKNSSFDGISLGWGEMPQAMRSRFGTSLTLQGNLDPTVLYAPGNVIQRETMKMIKQFGSHRYIANLGHGMEPTMTPEAVSIFLDTVKQINPMDM